MTHILSRDHTASSRSEIQMYTALQIKTRLSSAQLWWSSRYLKVNQRVFYTSKYKQYSQRRFTRVQDCKFDSKNKINSFLRICGLHGLVTLTAPTCLAWFTFSFACLHGDQNIDPGFIIGRIEHLQTKIKIKTSYAVFLIFLM